MVEKVVIKDNTNTPLRYLKDVPTFENGKEYTFKAGVNVIVGENGSGKTTLLKLIGHYLLLGNTMCDSHKVYNLFDFHDKFLDGADVYSDYTKNVFRMCHPDEMTEGDVWLESFENFGATFMQKYSSTGEGIVIALNRLFNVMFNKKTSLNFPIKEISPKYHQKYLDYINVHKVDTEDEYTILIDEPDRNLSLTNIKQIESILSYHKEQCQMIAVIHHPLLIYALMKNEDINFIEMTDGYLETVKNCVEDIVK